MTQALAQHIQDIIIARRTDLGQILVNIQIEDDYTTLTWKTGDKSSYWSERYQENENDVNLWMCNHTDLIPTDREFEEHMKSMNEYGTA